MWVLVAVYLGLGSSVPTMQQETYKSKEQCREVAALYVNRARVGQARAFCLKVKEK